MRTVIALTLLGALAVGAIFFVTSSTVDATVTTLSNRQPGARLVALETKVIEVNQIAMTEAGIRLNSINADEDAAALTEKALQFLRSPDETPGVRMIADLAYTIPSGRPARFASGVDWPTQATSLSGGGVSMQGFSGYQKSEVSATFTASEGSGDQILLHVDYQTRNRIGDGVDGLPPSRSSRSGTFAALIPAGEVRVLGGMIRSDEDASYLLFFLKPRWRD